MYSSHHGLWEIMRAEVSVFRRQQVGKVALVLYFMAFLPRINGPLYHTTVFLLLLNEMEYES